MAISRRLWNAYARVVRGTELEVEFNRWAAFSRQTLSDCIEDAFWDWCVKIATRAEARGEAPPDLPEQQDEEDVTKTSGYRRIQRVAYDDLVASGVIKEAELSFDDFLARSIAETKSNSTSTGTDEQVSNP